MSNPCLTLRDVGKTFDTPDGPFEALAGISIEVNPSDLLAIVGKSGSGKSTLVNMITGLDTPSTGTIHSSAANGTQIETLDQDELALWRGHEVGVVFQFFQLLPTLSIAENIILPMELIGVIPRAQRRERAMDILADLGISEQADKLPHDMSGGQQQRAAIARSLANDPSLIVADEPTGNLDSATSAEVMELFERQTKAGKAVVMVTHEPDLSKYFTRTITLHDGRMVEASA